jgi:pyruvate dehydrogenase E1 component beta subunit
LDAPIHRVCAKDVPIPFAKNLEDDVLPSPAKIVAGVQELMR